MEEKKNKIETLFLKTNVLSNKIIETKIVKRTTSTNEKELSIFLYTIFQYYLEKAIELMNSDSSEKKDKARKIIMSLLENINYIKSNKIIFSCLNGILYFYLGLTNFVNEENSSSNYEVPFLKSLDFFNTLPTLIKLRFINIYQEAYNNLGIAFYNKGEIKKGLQYLGKAEQMYKVFNDINTLNINNNFSKFLLNCCRSDKSSGNDCFNFFIDGGLNKVTLEQNYTLTIFYIAQAYTKLGYKNKAIKYCAITLKRQIEYNEYDLKDSIINCINLADFFMENQYFAQAEYILIAALSLLPDDPQKKKKLRANVQIQLGRYFAERIKFSVHQTKEQLWICENEELCMKVNKRIITFNNLNIKWPRIEDVRDIEQAKMIFRLSNTQFKKALELFHDIDKFPNEHIQINRELSSLYKYLTFFETENNRIFAMIERRLNFLEPLIKYFGDKCNEPYWQEILLELSDVYFEYFEKKYEICREKHKTLSHSVLEEVNYLGEKSTHYYSTLINFLESEFQSTNERTIEDLQTLIQLKINVAKISSRLIYKESKKTLASIKNSLALYKEAYNIINNLMNNISISDSLKNQYKLCEEMIHLLPMKINKFSMN